MADGEFRVSGKTEYDIDTWSYRRGVSDGWIPSNASNTSTYAIPVLENGCVDTTYNYTAPGQSGQSAAGRLSASWAMLGMALVCAVSFL